MKRFWHLNAKQTDESNNKESEKEFVNPYKNQDHVNMKQEEWQLILLEKRNHLMEIVNKLMPELWEPLEFALSVKSILNVKDCSLPFSGIITGATKLL